MVDIGVFLNAIHMLDFSLV